MSVENALILVAEDEANIAEIIVSYLERAGLRAVTARDGEIAIAQHRLLNPDLVLLDVKLPKRDGVDVLRTLRQYAQTPVIMVTAMAEDLEKISALRLGADDYVVKPFNPLELVERVKAVLRRADAAGGPARILRAGVVEIDPNKHAVFVVEGSERSLVALTPTEYTLIAHMGGAPQRAYARSELVDACLPEGEALERTIDSHVSNARRKLEAAGARGYLEAVRGIGYRLQPLQ
ncbi:MAG: response regulator [Caulobacterales bacterium]|nr:response regulator [Caulobacterales bacterium]